VDSARYGEPCGQRAPMIAPMFIDLVSDQPMVPEGVKTEASDRKVTDSFVQRHIEIGVEALRLIRRHGKSVRHLRFEDGPGGD
jgi:hypothetical protein